MKKLFAIVLIVFLCSFNSIAEPLTFVNSSWRPIHLSIPGVMNATLSPFSSSTAGLEPGQVIFFKYKGEQTILITINEGDGGKKLNIGKLIKSRKKELKKEASSFEQ